MNQRRLLTLALLMTVASGCGRMDARSSAGTSEKAAPPVKALTAADIRDRVSNATNKVTLLHFWATWCPPCVHEFPHIVKLRREYHDKGFDIMLVSMDREGQRGTVNDFVTKHGVDWQTYIAAEVTSDFLETISINWSGAIPTSFFYGADGKLRNWWEGARSYEEHEKQVKRLMAH